VKLGAKYFMAKTLGDLITWTTYGTWLQGDERGYVKNGKVYTENTPLRQANILFQSQGPVRLSAQQQNIVADAIISAAGAENHHIYAIAVKTDHIHIALRYSREPSNKIVARYKTVGRIALKSQGHTGNLWTRGYDKRFCFDQQTLEQKINYVRNHNKNI
jgi:REP element-mobilizing transposase RayT